MSLPQIKTPEFLTQLPSTGEKIAFRPFLVKEEKILLMAQQGKDESEIMIRGVKDSPGIAASILGPIGDADIEVDMIVQNVGSDGLADFTFTVSRKDFNKAIQVIEKNKKKMNFSDVSATKNIVKVSLIGVGMRSHAGIAGQMFSCLARKKINIRMISTSEIKISVVIDQKNLENAVKALHNEFKLERK